MVYYHAEEVAKEIFFVFTFKLKPKHKRRQRENRDCSSSAIICTKTTNNLAPLKKQQTKRRRKKSQGFDTKTKVPLTEIKRESSVCINKKKEKKI